MIKPDITHKETLAALMFYRPYLYGSGLFFRKKIGKFLFDEKAIVVDDYDFILRLMMDDKHLGFVKETLLKYRRHPKNTSKVGFAIYKGVSSFDIEKYVLSKHPIDKVINLFMESIFDTDVKHAKLGVYFLRLGEIYKAKTEFEESLKTNPNNIEALFEMGFILSKQGELLKAIDYYGKLISMNLNRADVFNNYGVLLLKSGNSNGINYIEQAVALNKNYLDAKYNIVNFHNLESLKLSRGMLSDESAFFT